MKTSAVSRAVLLSVMVVTLVAGCSRERIDWKSAESADTLEAYDHFLSRHPDSALATQARARMEQLVEDRDWRRASATDTADAYKQFVAQHATGKSAEEARIRIENFTLENNASPTATDAASSGATAAGAAQPGEAASAETPPAAVSPKSSPDTPANVAPAAPAKPGSPAAASKVAAQASQAAPPNPDSTGFGIQLGAFATQAAALGAWKNLQMAFDPELHGLFAHAVPVDAAAGKLFRLQSPVGEESRARAICAALAKKSQPCVVVLPQPR